jgi:hypothetical protein
MVAKTLALRRRRGAETIACAAFASRLRTLRRTLGSEAVEAAENRGRDVGSAERAMARPSRIVQNAYQSRWTLRRPTRILERQKVLQTGQVLFRRLSVDFALVLPFKDSQRGG